MRQAGVLLQRHYCEQPHGAQAHAQRRAAVRVQRTRFGERPYASDEPGCGYRTAEAGNLKKHKRTHNHTPSVIDRVISCDRARRFFIGHSGPAQADRSLLGSADLKRVLATPSAARPQNVAPAGPTRPSERSKLAPTATAPTSAVYGVIPATCAGTEILVESEVMMVVSAMGEQMLPKREEPRIAPKQFFSLSL
ncbi:hypothetical protein T492DRAFT_1145423 [Pavlovales sp. CCMP2436]|nr:hypothetical protein T492DRAFT_1145423 [Pavlovales sp. CCMP2436]